jgi:hypothetical protein
MALCAQHRMTGYFVCDCHRLMRLRALTLYRVSDLSSVACLPLTMTGRCPIASTYLPPSSPLLFALGACTCAQPSACALPRVRHCLEASSVNQLCKTIIMCNIRWEPQSSTAYSAEAAAAAAKAPAGPPPFLPSPLPQCCASLIVACASPSAHYRRCGPARVSGSHIFPVLWCDGNASALLCSALLCSALPCAEGVCGAVVSGAIHRASEQREVD